MAGTTQATGGDRGSNNFDINKHTRWPQLREEGLDNQVQGEASSLVCSLWSGIKSFNKISSHLPLMQTCLTCTYVVAGFSLTMQNAMVVKSEWLNVS